MTSKIRLVAGLGCLLAVPAFAQVPPPPLDLALPAAPASAATAVLPHATAAMPHAAPAGQPGVYYGDTSGRMGNVAEATRAPACDDSTYNQPQVHGSVGMGVVGGSHVSGNYETGTVSVSKRYGSCDAPTGGASMSISVGTGHFGGRIR